MMIVSKCPNSISVLFSLLLLTTSLFAQTAPTQTQQAPAAAPQIAWANIGQMIAAPANSYFFLEAKIKSVKAPEEGSQQPWVLYVEDNTGIARVVIFQQTWTEIEKPEQFEPGIIIQVYGKTNDYNNIRQLLAEGPKWIRLKPDALQIPDRLKRGDVDTATKDDFAETSIGGISISAIGHNVLVRGVVKQIQASDRSRVPTKILLADTTGEIEVIYWSEVSQKLTYKNTPVEGRTMEFKGEVGEYKNVMQIVVSNPDHITPVDGGISMNLDDSTSTGKTQIGGFGGTQVN